MSEFVIKNGELTQNLIVNMDDRGFTLGDGLFETIALYDGEPFLPGRHFDRMKTSAEKIELALPLDERTALEAITTLAKRNDVKRGVARLTVTRGAGPRGYAIDQSAEPTWILTCRHYKPIADRKRDEGFALGLVSIRKNPQSPVSGLKTLSSLENILALTEAKKMDCDEALILTVDGHIASGSAVNIFWARGGKLETPSTACGVLPGITRGVVMEIAREEGISVAQGTYPPEILEQADEIFVTNSLLEIVPVSKIAGVSAAPRPGQVTKRLMAKYRSLVTQASRRQLFS